MRLLFLGWLLVSGAHAITYLPHTQTLSDSSTEISVSAGYFQPTYHTNTNSELVTFGPNESFTKIESETWIKYGFTSQLQLGAGLRYRSNTGSMDNGTTVTNLNNSGLESYLLSFRYSFTRKDNWQYALEGSYGQTTYKNDTTTTSVTGDNIVLGDDGQAVSAGISVSYLFESQNLFSGKVLYRNPSRSLSSEILAEGEYAMTWDVFSIYLGWQSVFSLQQDAYTQDPENKPQIASQSTYLFNSVNRSWNAPYGGVILRLGEKWRVEYKATNYLTGSSTDLGLSHLITIHRRTGGVDMFKEFNQAFKEYTIDASVSKTAKGATSAIVNVGLERGLKEGMKVDFYYFDYLGGNELIASGYVIKSGSEKSLVKITRRFSKRKVKEGTVARSGLITQ